MKFVNRIFIRFVVGFVAGFMAISVNATIVRFETSLGDFDVNLYDQDAPLTVANFLMYVESGAYDGTFIHRSVPDFVIQGGSFIYDGLDSEGFVVYDNVEELAPVTNEPVFSNVRGTIAMAKLKDRPHSATSQWFINLVDNSENLDVQNGGATVFGEVIDNGMAAVDAIADLGTYSAPNNLALAKVPLSNYSESDQTEGVAPTENNFIRVMSVSILNENMSTASGLSPARNSLITQQPPEPNDQLPTPAPQPGEQDTSNGGGAGSPLLILLISLLLLASIKV